MSHKYILRPEKRYVIIKAIRSSVKQAVLGKGFIISFFGVIGVIAVSSFTKVLEALRTKEMLVVGFHYDILENAFFSDSMMLALPILAAVPFTASFVDDIRSGFIKVYLHRTSIHGYITGRYVACALSGGFALCMGIIFAYVISVLVFWPMEEPLPKDAETTVSFTNLMSHMILFFFSGAFWSVTGLVFAALTNSRYMAYASPFIIYYVMIIFNERYFDTLYVFYPKEWTAPSPIWTFGKSGVVLFLVILILIMSRVFTVEAKRRLSQI